MIRGVQPREFMIFRNILKSELSVVSSNYFVKGHVLNGGLMTREIKTLMQKIYVNTWR